MSSTLKNTLIVNGLRHTDLYFPSANLVLRIKSSLGQVIRRYDGFLKVILGKLTLFLANM